MKKLLIAALLMFCGALPAMAQSTGTPVAACPTGGTINIVVTQATGNFFECDLPPTTTSTTIGFAAPSGVALSAPFMVIVKFVQGATSATTVGWASNVGSQTVTATASVITVVQFFYDPGSAHWYDVILKT